MRLTRLLAALVLCLALTVPTFAADPWLTIEGSGEGAGKGKHVVLVSGDEEYRSEEVLPALAKILATHGFKCTVLFAIDPKDGSINPNVTTNIPGLEALKDADLLVLFTRFRDLPDDQMKFIVDYTESGKPVIGLRTATHAFSLKSKTYGKYSWSSKEADFKGGYGKQVLGENWVNHHGAHGREGTRGIVAKGQEKHPILKGIEPGSIFGTTDVYTVTLPFPETNTTLLFGEVTESFKPDSKAVAGKKNDPMMPISWTKVYKTTSGKEARIFTTTMGAAEDFDHEGTRRMLVNACYWTLGLEDKIADKSKVDLVGKYKASPFGNNKFTKGVKPADLK